MHTAISATPLLGGRKEQVDCLLVHAGHLLLGGANSSLVAYRLPESATGSDVGNVAQIESAKTPAWAVRLSKAAKPIEQIKVIREANVFVTLSDAVISLHDIARVQDVGKDNVASGSQLSIPALPVMPVKPADATTTLLQTKGALTFAIDTSVQHIEPKQKIGDTSRNGAGYRHRATPSTVGRVYKPSEATLGRKAGANAALRANQRPISAALKGMEELQRDKEAELRSKATNAQVLSRSEGARRDSEGVMSIVSTLAVGCRRKVIIFRWVDGAFWDTKEIQLPHTPRTFAFPNPTTLFMGYTPSEYAILTIPLAASSSVADLRIDRTSQVTMTIPPNSLAGTQVDLYEWPLKVLTIPLTGRFDESDDATSNQSGGGNPLSSGGAAPQAAATASATGGMAAMAGAAFGGLGGYIGMGNRNKPLVIQIDGGEVLVCRDTMGVFLSEDGKPTRRDGIEWPVIPEEVSFIKPYVFSILPATIASNKQALSLPLLQVRSASTLVAVQTLPFPPIEELQNSTRGKTLLQSIGHAPSVRLLTSSTGGKPPLYVVVSPTERGALERDGCSIWCLEMKSWGRQIDELVEAEEFQEALALLNSIDDVLLEDKEERRAFIEALYAVSLFAAGKFDDAIEHFIELETNPARVIALYSEEISGALARDRSDWVEMFGGSKKSKVTAAPVPPSPMSRRGSRRDDSDTISIQSTRSRRGLTSDNVAIPRDRSRLVNLWGRRPQSMMGGDAASPVGSIASSPIVATPPNQLTGSPVVDTASTNQEVRANVGDTMPVSDPATSVDKATSIKSIASMDKRSTDALGRFLADRRRIFKPILETQGTSNSVTQSQIRRDPDWLLSLPSKPLAELNLEELTAVAQIVDTALFKTFLATKPALVGPLCRVENWCEVVEVEELLEKAGKYSELIALYGGKEMHGKALQLLRKFGDEEEDIEEKVGPTIRYLQSLGPEHFAVILENAHWVLGIDREMGMEIFCADTGKVSSLPRFDIVADLEKYDEELCIQFLVHLIQNRAESDPSLHEKLAFLLLKKASRQNGTDREQTASQLLHLLEVSHQYRAERVLNRLPTDDLEWAEARALLLGRLGQHEAALSIYIHRLHNHTKAEEYCRRIQQDDETSTVFLTLLQIYLRPSSKSDSQDKVELEAAIGLISRYGNRIDTISALQLLPPLVTIQAVESFTCKSLRQIEAKRNQRLVLGQIIKERTLQVDDNLRKLHSRRVKVTDTKTCPRCMKRLGNSVIAVDAQGAIMHYSCAKFDS